MPFLRAEVASGNHKGFQKISVFWNPKDHGEVGSISLRVPTLRKDLAGATKTFQDRFLRGRKVLLELPANLAEEPEETIENVVCSLLDVAFQAACARYETAAAKDGILLHVGGPGAAKRITRDMVAACIAKFERVSHARTMALLPGNIATPAYMARHIAELFAGVRGARVTILRKRDLEKGGYGLILGIGGSAAPDHAPVMVVVRRPARGASKAAPAKKLAIVGKGVTFDTGGLAIKSWEGMEDMKFDKIGAIYAAYALSYLMADPAMDGTDLVGVFPFAENAVSDRSLRPGDVVRCANGKTVEVSDPDAEGRLLLADAFAYLDRHVKPDAVIDIATLTGQATSVNCCHDGYFYAFPAEVKTMFEQESELIGERMLPMPTWEDSGREEILASKVADVVNTPYHFGDAYTAAIFLREFLPASAAAWVHIDLAHEVTQDMVPRGNGIRSILRAAQKMTAARGGAPDS